MSKGKIVKYEAVRFCRSGSILSFVTSENNSQTKPGKNFQRKGKNHATGIFFQEFNAKFR